MLLFLAKAKMDSGLTLSMLGIAVKENFGVTFSVVNEETKKHFYSVDTLAAYISANMPK